MTRLLKPGIALTLSALAFASLSTAPAALAAPAHALHARKMAAAKTVYVCKDCHAYYSPAMAKKLHYKDDMGHTLVKSAQIPVGYLDADKMKM